MDNHGDEGEEKCVAVLGGSGGRWGDDQELIAFHVFVPEDVKVAGSQVSNFVEMARDLIAFHVFVVGSSMKFLSLCSITPSVFI
jgi:hypothetical protein